MNELISKKNGGIETRNALEIAKKMIVLFKN
jgi:hypothetical protein